MAIKVFMSLLMLAILSCADKPFTEKAAAIPKSAILTPQTVALGIIDGVEENGSFSGTVLFSLSSEKNIKSVEILTPGLIAKNDGHKWLIDVAGHFKSHGRVVPVECQQPDSVEQVCVCTKAIADDGSFLIQSRCFARAKPSMKFAISGNKNFELLNDAVLDTRVLKNFSFSLQGKSGFTLKNCSLLLERIDGVRPRIISSDPRTNGDSCSIVSNFMIEDLEDGYYTLSAEVVDVAGQSSQQSIKFFIATKPADFDLSISGTTYVRASSIIVTGRGIKFPERVSKVAATIWPKDEPSKTKEVVALSSLQHPNIVEIIELHFNEGPAHFELYLITELMGTDLHRIICSAEKNKFDPALTKWISYQIGAGLAYLHAEGIVHRDLKPGNILIRSDTTVKIADFGSAASIEPGMKNSTLTTRYYCAPEIIVTKFVLALEYPEAVDLWALGCTLAEVAAWRPRAYLFPEEDDNMQVLMQRFFSQEQRKAARSDEVAWLAIQKYFLREKPVGTSRCAQIEKFIGDDYRTMDPEGHRHVVILIAGLLEANPTARVAAADCLKSDYFEGQEAVPQVCTLSEINKCDLGRLMREPVTTNDELIKTARTAVNIRKASLARA